MTHNHNTPTREATVMLVVGKADWTIVPNVDLIVLPVDCSALADVFDSGLIGLVDALITWDALDSTGEYVLVWSGTHEMVKGVCPVCDDVFPVSEGFPGDELNEGYDAVCCGCDPNEVDN